MIVARRPGRSLPLSWPAWQPPGADGLAAIVTPTASTGWADGLLARESDRLVVWAATGPQPEAQALARLRYPGVRAVTLVPARSDTRWVRLALDFAYEMSASRVGSFDQACLTSCSPPALSAGVVRIPHLITVERARTVSDAVLWELAPIDAAQHWFGGPLPDQRFFEAHLDSLLRLRSAVRRGQLPPRAIAAGLSELLGDRELSIRLVYEHATQFRRLLANSPNGRIN